MVGEVRYNIKRSTDSLADSRIVTWLNWAQELIASWHTYEEMKKNYTGRTVEGQKRYGFPTRMKDIHSLVLDTGGADSRKLIYVPAREYDLRVPRPEQSNKGKPHYYVDYGVNFELYRVPDAAYTLRLRCSVFPADLSSDDSTSQLLRKDALICSVATMLGFLSLREVEDATYWKNEFVTMWYRASLEADHSAEDWNPMARGFDSRLTHGTGTIADFYANPLIRSTP